MRIAVPSLIVSLAAALLAAPARAQPVQTETQAWNKFGVVFDVRQDAAGLLWLGTTEGVHTFDGVRFERWSGQPTASGPAAHAVLPARSGDVWVATGAVFLLSAVPSAGKPRLDWPYGGAGLVRTRAGQRRVFGTADGLPSDRVLALTETPGGEIWIGTERGLARGSGDRFVPVALGGSAAVTALAARDGELLVGTLDGLWVRTRDGGPWRHLSPELTVTAIRPAPDGSWWIGTHRGLWRARPGATALTHVALDAKLTDVAADGAGGAFVGAFSDLRHVDAAGRVTVVPEAPFALRLLRDREGSLWAATRASGLVQWRTPRLTNLTAGQDVQVAFAVLPVPDGSVWISSTLGLVRWRAGTSTVFRVGDPLPASQVRSLARTPDGVLWADGMDDGLVRVRDDRFDRVPPADLPRPKARSLFTDPAGKLWVGWMDGAVSRLDDAGPPLSWRTWSTTDGACAGPQQAATAHGGTVWFAGAGGLTSIAGGEVRCATERDGLPVADLRAVHADPRGDVWIAPDADVGLVHLRNGRMTGVEVEGTWGAFFGITADAAGALWLSSARGVAHVPAGQLAELRAGKRRSLRPLPFGIDDGMRMAECTSGFSPKIAVDGAGRVWVPTLRNVVQIHPAPPVPAGVAPVIRGVAVDGVEQPVSAALALARSATSVELRYTVPAFRAPHRVQLSHRLLGVDPGWVEAPPGRLARYGALPAGRLTFEVRALDEYGRPLGGLASLALVVPTPWHRHPLALGALALGLALAARFAHRRRVRAIQARHRLVDDERRRMARDLHDGLAQGFAAARLQVEVARQRLGHPEPGVRAALDAVDDALGSTQGELHRAIWALRNDDPRGVTVAELLRRLARDTSAFGRAIEVDAAEIPTVLAGDRHHEVEKILREAVLNAVKHAGAARITLHAEAADGAVVFEVRDDGRGIARARGSGDGGAGLLGMRERAARLGAAVSVTSGPGGGTRVRLSLPDPPAARNGVHR